MKKVDEQALVPAGTSRQEEEEIMEAITLREHDIWKTGMAWKYKNL